MQLYCYSIALAPASTSKASKVVARELCSIVTKGTVTPSFLRGDSLSDTEQLFLLAVTEGVCYHYGNSVYHTLYARLLTSVVMEAIQLVCALWTPVLESFMLVSKPAMLSVLH